MKPRNIPAFFVALSVALWLGTGEGFSQDQPAPGRGPTQAGGAPSGSSTTAAQASGGKRLSSKEVSDLPLNKRDFSQLLLLAAGTMTDTNGAANFTQQFAVNGQRGSAAVFAMDGIDATDADLGGSTFSNINVDAIREVRSLSGVMAVEIGHGSAGFADVITRSGTNDLHGFDAALIKDTALGRRGNDDAGHGRPEYRPSRESGNPLPASGLVSEPQLK